MTGGATRRALGLAVTLAVAGSLAAGCALGADQAGRDARQVLAGPTTTAPATTTTTQPDCQRDRVAPFPPLQPAGTPFTSGALKKIQDHGKLIVGVDQNSLRLSAFNPTDKTFSGLEIDLLKHVAHQIFGDANDRLEYRVILSSQREDAIQKGTVDIVADAVTKTCARLSSFIFSNTYLAPNQRLLVRSDSDVTSIADLNGKTVCATTGTTTLAKLREFKDVTPYPVDARTDCLVALQEGKVDAITSDETILRGLQDQDPYTKIVGGPLEDEPYGMLVGLSNGQHQDLANLVNGVLDQMSKDGTLGNLINFWYRADQTPAQLAKEDHDGG